jgi:uncharacterized protein involved in copper resistance
MCVEPLFAARYEEQRWRWRYVGVVVSRGAGQDTEDMRAVGVSRRIEVMVAGLARVA